MSSQHPNPAPGERWTQSRFAAFIDVDPAVISRALARGILTKGADWITWNRELHRYQAATAAGRSADEDLNLATERAKLARAQTEKLRIEIQKARGEFVSVPAICALISQSNAIIRSKLLALPGRIKSEVPQLRTEGVVVVDRLVYETLDELAHQRFPPAVLLKMEVLTDAALNQEISKTDAKKRRPKNRKRQKNGSTATQAKSGD